MTTAEVPAEFRAFRDLFVIHTDQMLKLDRKPPIYGVALLVTVACEVVSKLLNARSGNYVFAEEITGRRNVPLSVGRDIFDVLRNGLAHSYGPHPIIVGDSTVRLTLSWKGGPHLRAIGLRRVDGHNRAVPIEDNERPEQFLCIDAQTLHEDLVGLFDRIERRFLEDATFAAEVTARARKLQAGEEPKTPQGPAQEEWARFMEKVAFRRP